MSDDKENLTGHQYDGIEEYDNPLPAWWLWTFLFTIIFGFLYWIHYEFGGGPTQLAELSEDMSRNQALNKQALGAKDSDEELLGLASSQEALGTGKLVFESKCVACHGKELQGLIGPNLVDEFWIHGKGGASEIAGIIRVGVVEKGMPPWDGQLKDGEIKAVTAYIFASRGQRPPNPKAPQGEKVVPN